MLFVLISLQKLLNEKYYVARTKNLSCRISRARNEGTTKTLNLLNV